MNGSARRVAVLGGSRIPFARQDGPYASASNQDMLTATLDSLLTKFGLEGEATILVANKIALGQIECGIAGGVDTTSDAPIAVNEDLREVLLELNRAKSNAGRLRTLTKLLPQQIVPEIPRNSEPRTGLSMGEHTRAIGKEVKKGATSQLIYVALGAEDQLESTMRFFLSPKSASVSGQVVYVGAAVATGKVSDWRSPLNGKVALVTGAARGIGAAIAEVLARDGAHVVGLDVEPMADQLAEVAGRLGGSSLTADITDPDAPAPIADHLLTEHGSVDIVVHNAGVTRDKTLGRMTEEQWNLVIGINLTAPQRIDEALLERKAVRRNGRIVSVSSISGIAGNAGQTNYSTSKAGVIGFVHAWAPQLAKRGITINAVAPGFIETRMTAAMPIAIREAGRRMNSVSQGGLPIDVAETIAWFANPASGGITGNIVRVCGQSLLGA